MQMIMYCEVLKQNKWEIPGIVFQSALMEELKTVRVCDEHNLILYEIFGGPKTHRGITEIGGVQKTDTCFTVSLDNILAYNWDAQIHKTGLISEWQYKRLKEQGIEPVHKRNKVFDDKNTAIVSPFEMDMILKDDSLRTFKKYYVKYDYDFKSMKDLCAFFCEVSIPALMKLAHNSDFSTVRVVYNFV